MTGCKDDGYDDSKTNQIQNKGCPIFFSFRQMPITQAVDGNDKHLSFYGILRQCGIVLSSKTPKRSNLKKSISLSCLYDNDLTSIIDIYFYETFSTPNPK
jgi:hypothetical protein